MMRRMVDPGQPVENQVKSLLGVETAKQQRQREDRRADRLTPASFLTVTREFAFFREDLGATGDAAYTTRTVIPTAAATFGSVNGTGFKMPRAGVIVEGYIQINTPRTQGTITLRVRVTNGAGLIDYTLTDCVINATDTQTASCYFRIKSGIPVAAGDVIDCRLVTAGTFLPNTADGWAKILIATAEDVNA
jgi:hypothetical protein